MDKHGLTIPEFIKNAVDRMPNGIALCWRNKREDQWKEYTYAEYFKLIYEVSKSFLEVFLAYSQKL